MIEELGAELDIISALEDEPNDVGGLTAAELKARFDEAGNIIKNYINGTLLPGLNAENIVFYATESVPADTVQEAVANVQAQISGVTLGQLPDASVTAEKLAQASVSFIKLASDIYATQAQAEQGTLEYGVMNPLRTAQAIRALCPMSTELILERTVETAAEKVQLDLSGTDLGVYRKLEVQLDCVSDSNAYWYMRVNDSATATYTMAQIYAGSDNVYNAEGQAQVLLRSRLYSYSKRSGEIVFLLNSGGKSIGGSYCFNDGSIGTFCTPVNTLSSVEIFLGAPRTIAQGSVFRVYGVRK